MATIRMSEAEAIRRGILPPKPDPKPGPLTPPKPPRGRFGYPQQPRKMGMVVIALAIIYAWFIGFAMGLAVR